VKPNVLVVDDDPGIQFGFSKYLSKKGYALDTVSCLSESRDALRTKRFDAVLLDLQLPDGSGLDYIAELKENHPHIAIVVITGVGDIPVAVEAMRRGADNFLTKPVEMADLDISLQKSLELEGLRRKEVTRQRLARQSEPYFGESPAIHKVVDLATAAAESDSAVIVQGETGTGKGVLARWIHDKSERRSAVFVEVNCSALRGELLASELFGHAKGAFTSAVEDRQGLVSVADGGTLFLDEIGDMAIGVQAQLLKVIEEKHYRKLGEVKVRRSEFRLLCATNHDLAKLVEGGAFRKDLFYRINVFPIQIPPLRERSEDLPGLLESLLRSIGRPQLKLSDEVVDYLRSYSWPGNIREVKNVLERAVVLSRGAPFAPEHFPGLEGNIGGVSEKEARTLDKIEDAHIRKTLEQFSGDVRRTAETLGMSRATLYRKIKKLRERPN
jgi:DNA-binding NtrC family response regulator